MQYEKPTGLLNCNSFEYKRQAVRVTTVLLQKIKIETVGRGFVAKLVFSTRPEGSNTLETNGQNPLHYIRRKSHKPLLQEAG